MALSAVSKNLRSQCPAQHQAAFDACLAGLSASDEAGVGGFWQTIIAFIKALGLSINWPCLISTTTSMLPQILAALSNPMALLTLIPAFIAAYVACVGPKP